MKCVKCKDDYKAKSNTIKMGKYWCEVYNNDGYDKSREMEVINETDR